MFNNVGIIGGALYSIYFSLYPIIDMSMITCEKWIIDKKLVLSFVKEQNSFILNDYKNTYKYYSEVIQNITIDYDNILNRLHDVILLYVLSLILYYNYQVII